MARPVLLSLMCPDHPKAPGPVTSSDACTDNNSARFTRRRARPRLCFRISPRVYVQHPRGGPRSVPPVHFAKRALHAQARGGGGGGSVVGGWEAPAPHLRLHQHRGCPIHPSKPIQGRQRMAALHGGEGAGAIRILIGWGPSRAPDPLLRNPISHGPGQEREVLPWFAQHVGHDDGTFWLSEPDQEAGHPVPRLSTPAP